MLKNTVFTLCQSLYKRLQHCRYWFFTHRRQHYLTAKRRKLKNTQISIICNNCIGGIIYSDLGLRFLSPTINLFFSTEDYLEFLNDLEYYLNCEPIPKDFPEYSYPVGALKKGNREIYVHFMHYHSFEEARDKWMERAKRVNFDNLHIIFEYPNDICSNDQHIYQRFKQLPYAKKRMITYAPQTQDKEVVHCSIYRDNYCPGKILLYPTQHSKKRYLDCFDYVSFFNID